MSTVFIRCTLLSLLVGACGKAPPSFHAFPAPPADSTSTAGTRQWSRVLVSGPHGAFEMSVPAITLTPSQGGAGSIVIDSVALDHVEQRLSERIASIARSQAAAILPDTTPPILPPRNPAPEIKAGKLGAIPFVGDELTLNDAAAARAVAVARLADELPGRLEIVVDAEGTGAAFVDIALARARRVYLELTANVPRLAEREVSVIIRTHTTLLGAPRAPAVVEVYVAAGR